MSSGGAPELGSEVGGYRLESLLGQGGMGTVYLARGREGGLCAVKVLSRRLVDDDLTFATRFKREVQYAEALDHPNVLELYEAGETPDGTLFFAMQYVDGPDLGVLLRDEGVLSVPQALLILGPIADALDSAHASGLVHRDVKPGNIIVASDPDGPHPYLTDFGLSKNPGTDSFALTRMGQLIGTLAYTAPEEILASEPRGAAVDVYSLGCVLFEVLTGAPPFVRARDIDVLYAHVGDPRPKASETRASLPEGIDDVIARAMAISAPERYASCGELIAAVRGLLSGQEATGAVATPAPEETAVAPPEPPIDTPAGALRLVVQHGLGLGLAVIVEDEVVLGREETLDGALIPDHSVSRRHARITRLDEGTFAIEDEHSRNGTFVNGERLSSPHILRTGDRVKIGTTVFEAFAPEARPIPAVPAPPAEPEPAEPEPAEPEPAEPEPAEPGPVVPGPVLPGPVVPTAPLPEAAPVAEVVAEGATPLALRLALDPDAGVLEIAIEGGPTVRIVRGSDGWHAEPS